MSEEHSKIEPASSGTGPNRPEARMATWELGFDLVDSPGCGRRA